MFQTLLISFRSIPYNNSKDNNQKGADAQNNIVMFAPGNVTVVPAKTLMKEMGLRHLPGYAAENRKGSMLLRMYGSGPCGVSKTGSKKRPEKNAREKNGDREERKSPTLCQTFCGILGKRTKGCEKGGSPFAPKVLTVEMLKSLSDSCQGKSRNTQKRLYFRRRDKHLS